MAEKLTLLQQWKYYLHKIFYYLIEKKAMLRMFYYILKSPILYLCETSPGSQMYKIIMVLLSCHKYQINSSKLTLVSPQKGK